MKIQLSMINDCQLRCATCAPKLLDRSMDFDEMKRILASFEWLENVDLTPIAGESLLLPDIADRIRYVESCKNVKHFDMVTNLVALDAQTLRAMVECKKFGLFVSVYGHDESSFCEFTGAPLFDDFRIKLGWLYHALMSGSEMHVSFYMRHAKLDEIPSGNAVRAIIKSLIRERRCGLDESTVRCNFNWGGRIKVDDPAPMPEMDGACLHSIVQRAVLPGGDVTACGMVDFDRSMVVGNVFKDGIAPFVRSFDRGACRRCNEYEPV